MPPPEVPVNYFGKGKDYSLSDDSAEVQEFERRWREWEAAHPEDPTGEITLRHYEDTHSRGSKSLPASVIEAGYKTAVEAASINFGDTTPLELEMPKETVLRLKRFASFKRKRPRDVVNELILQFCRF